MTESNPKPNVRTILQTVGFDLDSPVTIALIIVVSAIIFIVGSFLESRYMHTTKCYALPATAIRNGDTYELLDDGILTIGNIEDYRTNCELAR